MTPHTNDIKACFEKLERRPAAAQESSLKANSWTAHHHSACALRGIWHERVSNPGYRWLQNTHLAAVTLHEECK